MKEGRPRGGRPRGGRPLPPRDQIKPGMMIMDVSRLIHDRMREQEQMLGIKSGYRLMLFHLSEQKEGVPQLYLVQRSHLKAPTVSLTLQNMERDGLIERRLNEADQRESLVTLTAAGRELDQKLRESIRRVETLLCSAIPEEQQQELIEILLKIRGELCSGN